MSDKQHTWDLMKVEEADCRNCKHCFVDDIFCKAGKQECAGFYRFVDETPDDDSQVKDFWEYKETS